MDEHVRVPVLPYEPENTSSCIEFSEERVQKYELISKFFSICTRKNLNELKKLKNNNKMFLKKYNIQFSEFLKKKISTEDDWEIFQEQKTEEILRHLYSNYYNDDEELLFFASALFEVQKLQEIKNRQKNVNNFFNKIRNTDSALVFALKYGNINNKNFFSTMQFLVKECNVDTKKIDQEGKAAIDYVAELYKNYQNGKLLVDFPKILTDNDILSENINKLLQTKELDCEEIFRILKSLIDECNVDFSKYKKRETTIDYLKEFYIKRKNEIGLLNLAKMLTDKGVYNVLREDTKNFLRENDIDFENKMQEMDEKNKLFYWISTKSYELFCNFSDLKKMANSNNGNGENTLLQYAVRKLRLNIVQKLLQHVADPNSTTNFEIRTPLELSIYYSDDEKIFEELLKKTKVNKQRQFNNLVANLLTRPKIPLKNKMFQLLLRCDKLQVGLVHEATGNTPLHFAVLFSNRQAIESLLSRGASLFVKNKAGKAVIDIIGSQDLHKFFDTRLIVNPLKPNVTVVSYKVQLDFFRSLIGREELDEFYVISKLSKNEKLRLLLTHPLVYTFIRLKWAKIKIYFWLMLVIQFFLLLSLSTCLWLPPIPAFFIGLFNMAAKFAILPKLKQAPVHVTLEISLIVIHIFGLFMHQVRAFLFILMSMCFLITTGYHPKLSKWSIMLQTVFKTFTLLLIFVSLVLFSFSVGFFVLFSSDGGNENKFRNISTSFFKTFIMTAGELSLDDISFDSSGFYGYLILVIFTLYVPLVIVNFWTAVAVTDVNKIEKEAELNDIINVVLFMQFVDHIYDKIMGWRHSKKCLCSEFSHIISFFKRNYQESVVFFKNFISKFSFSVILKTLTRKPFLFIYEENNKKYLNTEKCKVDSYIDSKDQLARPDKENGRVSDVTETPARDNTEDKVEIDEECHNRIFNYVFYQRKLFNRETELQRDQGQQGPHVIASFKSRENNAKSDQNQRIEFKIATGYECVFSVEGK